jgi:hypothetical protein
MGSQFKRGQSPALVLLWKILLLFKEETLREGVLSDKEKIAKVYATTRKGSESLILIEA